MSVYIDQIKFQHNRVQIDRLLLMLCVEIQTLHTTFCGEPLLPFLPVVKTLFLLALHIRMLTMLTTMCRKLKTVYPNRTSLAILLPEINEKVVP